VKLVFNSVTIGDDSTKYFCFVDQWGAQSLVQNDPLAFGANPFVDGRGNISGVFAARVAHSHDTRQAAEAYFAAELARLNTQSDLVITVDGKKITHANALLHSVIANTLDGTFWVISYTFTFTTTAVADVT
jgi:hypothetical protein